MKKTLLFTVCTLGLLSAGSASAMSAAPFWTAICYGDKDYNFTMTVGDKGVFNQGLGNGSYQSYPVHQTFYTPTHKLCGAVKGSEQFAQICADNDKQIITIKYHDPKHPKGKLIEGVLCKALVKIH